MIRLKTWMDSAHFVAGRRLRGWLHKAMSFFLCVIVRCRADYTGGLQEIDVWDRRRHAVGRGYLSRCSGGLVICHRKTHKAQGDGMKNLVEMSGYFLWLTLLMVSYAFCSGAGGGG